VSTSREVTSAFPERGLGRTEVEGRTPWASGMPFITCIVRITLALVGQMAKCHVWPPDRFYLENTRFFHLAMSHLAI
jgi:hypothetical protein